MTREYRSRAGEDTPGLTFLCECCGDVVPGTVPGSKQRNHCPHCLWSLHVDRRIGDRASGCQGQMEPISVWVIGNSEWRIVHRCTQCGLMRANRVAGDDSAILLMSMATRPLANPPFPLSRLQHLYTESVVDPGTS